MSDAFHGRLYHHTLLLAPSYTPMSLHAPGTGYTSTQPQYTSYARLNVSIQAWCLFRQDQSGTQIFTVSPTPQNTTDSGRSRAAFPSRHGRGRRARQPNRMTNQRPKIPDPAPLASAHSTTSRCVSLPPSPPQSSPNAERNTQSAPGASTRMACAYVQQHAASKHAHVLFLGTQVQRRSNKATKHAHFVSNASRWPGVWAHAGQSRWTNDSCQQHKRCDGRSFLIGLHHICAEHVAMAPKLKGYPQRSVRRMCRELDVAVDDTLPLSRFDTLPPSQLGGRRLRD